MKTTRQVPIYKQLANEIIKSRLLSDSNNWKQTVAVASIGAGLQVISMIAIHFKIALLSSFTKLVPLVGVAVNLICLWRNYRKGFYSFNTMFIQMGAALLGVVALWCGAKIGAAIGSGFGGPIGAAIGAVLAGVITWASTYFIYRVEFKSQLQFVDGLRNDYSVENQTMRRKYYCNPKLKVC